MVSRLTAINIATNDIIFLKTRDRVECWICRDGRPHALQLSAPLDKEFEFVAAVTEIRERMQNELDYQSPEEKDDET